MKDRQGIKWKFIHRHNREFLYRFCNFTAVKHEAEVHEVEHGEEAEENVGQNDVHVGLQNTSNTYTHTQSHRRHFSVAAPRVWNSLTLGLKTNCDSLGHFIFP